MKYSPGFRSALTGLRWLSCIAFLLSSVLSLASLQWPTARPPIRHLRSSQKIQNSSQKSTSRIGWGKAYPWEWKYNIKVFDVAAMSKPLWKSEYDFHGSSDGALSNDGSYFVHVDFWFFDEGPIVYIYKKGSTKKYSAQDLHLTSKGLQKTVSHKLWLKDGGGFWPASGTPSKFIINTVQGERSIDL